MKVTSKTSTKRILQATRKLIDQGWVQTFEDERTVDVAGRVTAQPRACYCLSAAVSKVCTNGGSVYLGMGSNKPFDRAIKALAANIPSKTVKKLLQENPEMSERNLVIGFNDADERKIKDIYRVLDKALEAA